MVCCISIINAFSEKSHYTTRCTQPKIAQTATSTLRHQTAVQYRVYAAQLRFKLLYIIIYTCILYIYENE